MKITASRIFWTFIFLFWLFYFAVDILNQNYKAIGVPLDILGLIVVGWLVAEG